MKTNIKTSLFALISAVVLFAPFTFAEGEPKDVSSVTATPIDSTSIGLSWDAVTDADGGLVDHYRLYYGTTSIQEAGIGEYDSTLDTPNNNTSYVVTGLTPDTTYYFSMTAMNAAGLESEMYSYEGSATTQNESTEKLANCDSFPEKLILCEPFLCEFEHPFTGEMMKREIAGLIDGKCQTTEEAPGNSTINCKYTKDLRKKAAEHHKKFYDSGSVSFSIKQGSINQTIGGEEIDPKISEALMDACTILTPRDLAEKDIIAPEVANVITVDKAHVKVTFSEAVKLPNMFPESAFSINEQVVSTNTLKVTGAKIDTTDTTGKTILLTTVEQIKNINYIVTAGIAITDLSDNPIVSGNTDSGMFVGSDVEPIEEVVIEEIKEGVESNNKEDATKEVNKNTGGASSVFNVDTTAPTVIGATSVDKNHIEVVFSEPVMIVNLSSENSFSITEKGVPTNTLEIQKTEIKDGYDLGKTITLTTASQLENTQYIVTSGTSVVDMSKNPVVSGNDDSAAFTGFYNKDTAAPENVTGLVLSFKKTLETFTVLMDWKASVDSAKDLVDQMVYMSTNRGKTYDSGKSLGKSATHNEVNNLEGGKEYTFKVTTKDEAGNESIGVVKSIRLPQTGLGISFLLFGSAAAANHALRRRKK